MKCIKNIFFFCMSFFLFQQLTGQDTSKTWKQSFDTVWDTAANLLGSDPAKRIGSGLASWGKYFHWDLPSKMGATIGTPMTSGAYNYLTSSAQPWFKKETLDALPKPGDWLTGVAIQAALHEAAHKGVDLYFKKAIENAEGRYSKQLMDTLSSGKQISIPAFETTSNLPGIYHIKAYLMALRQIVLTTDRPDIIRSCAHLASSAYNSYTRLLHSSHVLPHTLPMYFYFETYYFNQLREISRKNSPNLSDREKVVSALNYLINFWARSLTAAALQPFTTQQ